MPLLPTLPFLETMLTQVCNLSCLGCTNYSDVKFGGYVPWDQGREDILNWSAKLTIPDFGLIGGEPLINPDVRQWILGSRELLPHSQIRFTTNGLLLEKHFDVVDLLKDIGNSVLKITVHVHSPAVESTINRIFKRYKFEEVEEYGIRRWACGDFKFQINRPQTFIKSYQGVYPDILPHASDPNKSFSACCQKTCPLLYNSKIYKCSTSGLLPDLLKKFNKENQEEWRDYIDLSDSSITLTSADCEILRFIENFGNPHRICKMCPETADLDHYATVTFK